MKNSKGLLLVVLTVSLFLSIGINAYQFVQTFKADKLISQQEEKIEFYEDNYSTMYEHFTGLSILDFEKKVVSGEDFVAYFGRPDCGDCSEFEPMFMEVIEENNLANNLYYVNVKWKRAANKEQWEDFKSVYGFNGTPAFVHYQDGKAVSMIEWDDQKGLVKSDLKAWLENAGLGENRA